MITGVEEHRHETPSSFVLEQNFPNPFNPLTEIRYQLPVASDVSLRVFDLLGSEVAELVNEWKAPGSYKVRFDGKRLASGVYFYRIHAGEFVRTNRMLLLR